MTPHEFLGVLDDAIARAPRRPRRALVLTLNAREVLGQTGAPLGYDPRDSPPIYGYTRHQCEEMRAVILAAAAEDAGGAP